MKYTEYLKFYGLADTEENFEDWKYSEWHHGRAYIHEGEFFDTSTGKKISKTNE